MLALLTLLCLYVLALFAISLAAVAYILREFSQRLLERTLLQQLLYPNSVTNRIAPVTVLHYEPSGFVMCHEAPGSAPGPALLGRQPRAGLLSPQR